MNSDSLLAHYEKIADAPEAIVRLRRFILNLAVRGKLLPQDAGDEPASELLKRISKEKAQQVKAGTARKLNVDLIAPGDDPFLIPSIWTWTRLGSIGDWGSGSTPPRGASGLYDGTISWLKSGELNDNRALTGSEERITKAAVATGSFRMNKSGDVLIAMYGATIGKVAILAESAVTNQAVCGCTPFAGVFNQFLFLFLLSQREQFRSASEGGAQPNISKVKIVWTPFPLPPLAEQHRIVAKVDELMALCDQLEAARTAREQARDRLAAASLARLNAPDPETLQADVRFALHALPALSTRPDQIKQLRQTILNLAVRGKLVPQDPNDEPASELLVRIAKEKARLVKAGEIKRTKDLGTLSETENFDGLPRGWEASRLGNAYDVRDGTHDTPKYVDAGFPLITSKNLSSGHLSFAEVKQISERDHQQISERSRVDKGDVLLAMIGSIGNPVVVDTDRPFSIKNIALFKYYAREFSSPEFLRYFLQYATIQMKELAAGGLQPFVSLGFLRAYPIALPPLAEQRRIVAKVDALMALCDQLEASLTDTLATRRRLLDALLAEALAPAEQSELETLE